MLNSIENNVPVLAYEAKTCKFVGEFDSMAKAARALFIRSTRNMVVNIHSKRPNGVKTVSPVNRSKNDLRANHCLLYCCP